MVRVHSNVDDFPLAETPTKMKVNILGQVFGKLKPVSIDRINPNLGYFYENMQFVTSKENAEKGLQEFKLVKSRPISMYDYKTKELIMKFDCVKDAVTYTGLQQGNISKVLNGNRNKTGGYYFEYDQKEDSDVLTKIKQMLGKE